MEFETPLFGKNPLPSHERKYVSPLNLQELNQILDKISSNDGFLYTRTCEDGQQIITAVGKGLTIKFNLNYETHAIRLAGHTDSYATSDGTPTDVAPIALDTHDLINTTQKAIETAIKEVADPTLVE